MSEAREISVNLAKDLLDEMDDLAHSLDVSRDELLGDAMAAYLESRRSRDLYESLRFGYEEMGDLNLQMAESFLPVENEGSDVHLEALLGGGDFAGC